MSPRPSAIPAIEMPHWPPPLWRSLHGRPLDRMAVLLARLGNPQRHLPPVVHVAGTNGKGSTIAFLQAMLQAAGYRVHRYTSPHLQRFEERIQLAGQPISSVQLHDALERCRHACADDSPVTFFEGTTAAALLAFAETPADVLLLETGMGGREDPTNIIDTKTLTILTPIDIDHAEYLGPTVADIALHKSGILRAGVPCVVAPQCAEALAVIQAEAQRIGAPLWQAGTDWAAAALPDGSAWVYEQAEGQVLLPLPSLAGAHQLLNAATAVAALAVLEPCDVPEAAVREGLRNAEWPGRLQRFSAPLPEGWQLWMDGGHNPHGAQGMAQHVRTVWRDQPTHLVFGTTQGKALAPMLQPFIGAVESITAIPVRAEPTSYAATSIAEAAAACGAVAHVAGSVAEALEHILAQHAPPARILVFGSLYLHAECAALVRGT